MGRFLYAGSLVNLMEHGVATAFDTSSGDDFQGYTNGSNKLATGIKDRTRRGDVFISANSQWNKSLMGLSNGAWETWFVTLAEWPLVIGYNPYVLTPSFSGDSKNVRASIHAARLADK